MIAKEVTACIYGSLSDEGVYSGYITGEDIDRENAYILTKKTAFESFSGIVTAVVTLADGTQRAVVTPKNEIMYEPQILNMLSTARSVRVDKISCLYEKSCGAVILHRQRETGEINILLVRNHNGRFYSFPKGHVELMENEQETAIREIKEETNLDVEIFDGFREISDYCPFGKIRKRVVFFIAKALTDDIKIQESEIDSYIWVPLSDASNICTYDNDKRVIEKVKKYAEEHNLV